MKKGRGSVANCFTIQTIYRPLDMIYKSCVAESDVGVEVNYHLSVGVFCSG